MDRIKRRPRKTRPKKGWRTTQKDTKREKKIKLGFWALGILLGILLFGQAVRLTQSLFSPLKPDTKVNRPYLWDGRFDLNVVIKADGLALLSFNSTEKEVLVVNIPDEAYVEVPGGFGNWQFRAIYDLGRATPKIGGGRMLKSSVADLLGVPIDGYMVFQGSLVKKSSEELIEQLRNNKFDLVSFWSEVETDLAPWELIKMKWLMGGVRFDKVEYFDLKALGLMEEGVLGDGTPILKADPIKIDSALIDFVEPQIRQEHLDIAIFNGTQTPALAQKAARIVTNLGGKVIQTTNAQGVISKTYITGVESVTRQRLEQIFVLDCLEAPSCDIIQQNPTPEEDSRAQINIFLGEDFFLK